MQTRQANVLQSLKAVLAFLDANAAQLGAIVQSGARKHVDAAVAALTTHVVVQSDSALAAKGATQKKKALRLALTRDHMAPIARIAAAELPPTPEIEPLRMPKGKPSVEELVAAAYGMGKTATRFAPLFIDAGLPPDFVAQLNAAADAVVLSLNERTQSAGIRGGATKGLRIKLSDGRRAVHVIDAFIQKALKDDPSLLANWNIVKRVQRPTGRSTAGSPTTPST